MIREWIKAGAADLLCMTRMDRALAPRDLPVVVAYHRVVEDFGSSSEIANPSMLVSVKMLERHLDWIGKRYRFVDLDELGGWLESKSGSSRQIAAVTFDDGYQDFNDLALPILQRKGIPASIFVVTDYVGTTRVHIHDKLYLLLKRRQGAARKSDGTLRSRGLGSLGPYEATRKLLESLPVDKLVCVIEALESEDPISEEITKPLQSLSWETVNQLHRAGVTIGAHTQSHALMPNESKERVFVEAAGSRKAIEERVAGARVKYFAYPSGLFDATSVNAVAAAGYRVAFATTSGRSFGHPMLTIPRTVLWENSSLNSHNSFSGAVLDCQIQHTFEFFARVGESRQHCNARQENGR
jgi:peptidoglycan/xylan/chitin deacetylase (PgdA/CDA1 family)